jgi:hypothetical protein
MRGVSRRLKLARPGLVVGSEAADFGQTGVSLEAVRASSVVRVGLALLLVGTFLTAISIPASEDARVALRYSASLAFVSMWSVFRYGLWYGTKEWAGQAFKQLPPWFLGFVLASFLAGVAADFEGIVVENVIPDLDSTTVPD